MWTITFLLMLFTACCSAAVSLTECNNIGIFKDRKDCTRFKVCGTDARGFISRTFSCPLGQEFKVGECKPISKNSGCVQPSSPAQPSDRSAARDLFSDDPACNGKRSHCKDCSTLIKCSSINGVLTVQSDSSCQSLSANRPYCVNDACVPINRLSSQCKNELFRCTGTGVYPDPTDCKRFYICEGAGSAPASTITCSNPGNYASTLVNDCVRGSRCSRVLCPPRKTGFMPYRADSRFYVMCNPTEAVYKYEIYRCPFEQRFDLKQKICIDKCETPGKLPLSIPSDTADHLMCIRRGAKPVPAKCPTGLNFNVDLKRCVFNGIILTTPGGTAGTSTVSTNTTPGSEAPTDSTNITPTSTESTNTTPGNETPTNTTPPGNETPTEVTNTTPDPTNTSPGSETPTAETTPGGETPTETTPIDTTLSVSETPTSTTPEGETPTDATNTTP